MIEAMKQALEALEYVKQTYDEQGLVSLGTNTAIIDLRQAIAEAEKQEPVAKPKLIGWRTADFLNETTDIKLARNWDVHYEVLPIFEGDPNTKLEAAHGIKE